MRVKMARHQLNSRQLDGRKALRLMTMEQRAFSSRQAFVTVFGVLAIYSRIGMLKPLQRGDKNRMSLESTAEKKNYVDDAYHGRTRASKRQPSISDEDPLDMKLVICTRTRNEAQYLREWIEYHRMIGFDSIIILNDNSTDDTQCILDAYAKEGFVKRVPQDVDDEVYGRKEAFDNLVTKMDRVFDVCTKYLASQYDASHTWMLTHDVDEFVWFNQTYADETFRDVFGRLIRQHDGDVKSVAIPRLLFGSSGHDQYEPGLVIDRFTRRFDHKSCPNKGASKKRTTKDKGSPQRLPVLTRYHDDRKTSGKHRRLFNKEMYTKSYCSNRVHNRNSYDNIKSISLVSSLKQRCSALNKVTGKMQPRICQIMHNHRLKKGHDAIDTNILLKRQVSGSIEIMHYKTKSRQEFYHRTWTSAQTHIRRYFTCPRCSPGSYFNVTESYANNFEDGRMAPFAARLRSLLAKSSTGTSCNQNHPKYHSNKFYHDYFLKVKRGS